jgi:hypothetical protein
MAAEKPGTPDCAIVGTLGSRSDRAALVTAISHSVIAVAVAMRRGCPVRHPLRRIRRDPRPQRWLALEKMTLFFRYLDRDRPPFAVARNTFGSNGTFFASGDGASGGGALVEQF